MNFIYAVNVGAQDLRWGTVADADLSGRLQLGFPGHFLAIMPDRRHLYVTGHKMVAGVAHAWLAVVDTCDHTIANEIDLGPGFAGQCTPVLTASGPRAFVAVSQAAGGINTGTNGGTNRVVGLDVTNPASPMNPSAVPNIASGGPWGFLHIVWSPWTNRLYTSHRTDNKIWSFDPLGVTVQEIAVPDGPTGLGLSQDGQRLVVGRRTAGDYVVLDLTVSPPSSSGPVVLQDAVSTSAILVAVDRVDRIVLAPIRPPDPQRQRPSGILSVVDGPGLSAIDTGGSFLGQPAVDADAGVAYVPRGGQNDVKPVDLVTRTAAARVITTGDYPTDVALLSRGDPVRLICDPPQIATSCGDSPIPVMVRAFDLCGNEVPGTQVHGVSFGAATVQPLQPQGTPATFLVGCAQNGPTSVNFMMTSRPFAMTNLPVACDCLILHCLDFQGFPPGALASPAQLGPLTMTIVQPPPAPQPRIGPARLGGPPGPVAPGMPVGPGLQLNRATVRFQPPPGEVVHTLRVTIHRQAREPPLDAVTVTHSGGAIDTFEALSPTQGTPSLEQGIYEIVCPPQNVTEWTVTGGPESFVTEICFWSSF